MNFPCILCTIAAMRGEKPDPVGCASYAIDVCRTYGASNVRDGLCAKHRPAHDRAHNDHFGSKPS